VVLHRELIGLGFNGGYQQVQRLLKPRRDRRRWQEVATVRFETAPGEQAQVDYGQLQVWIGEQPETVHLFVFTLGYSRRLFTRGYRNERLATLLDGHERAFRHFGGVTLTCLYDNPRTLVLGRRESKVLWHPLFEDFARYYGFTPRACQPYRARTKGKVESGVKYVKRNALAGRRFTSWEELNDWLERWSAEVADLRIHGTTHERPIERFAREQLTPLGTRPPYRYERVQLRRVANDALVAVGAALLRPGRIRRVDRQCPREPRPLRDLTPGSTRRAPSEGDAAQRADGAGALRGTATRQPADRTAGAAAL
jgi:transposase